MNWALHVLQRENCLSISRAKWRLTSLHCKEESNYVFPEIKLRGLVLNFHIHTYVSDLYIPRTVHLFCCSQIGRPIAGRYKLLGTEAAQFPFWEFFPSFRYSIFTVCLSDQHFSFRHVPKGRDKMINFSPENDGLSLFILGGHVMFNDTLRMTKQFEVILLFPSLIFVILHFWASN
jgi:hypothetical protein